jgi:hypothetical protein
MHTNIKVDVHQGCNTFGEGRIRINIVPNFTDTNNSPLVRAMNNANSIAHYMYNGWGVTVKATIQFLQCRQRKYEH